MCNYAGGRATRCTFRKRGRGRSKKTRGEYRQGHSRYRSAAEENPDNRPAPADEWFDGHAFSAARRCSRQPLANRLFSDLA